MLISILCQRIFFHFTRNWAACLFALTFSICSNANSNTIVVLGDSLSAAYNMPVEKGWVHLLSNKLKTQYPAWQVINSSITGDTTASGLQRLPNLLKAYQPKIVIIELGGNDGLRGYPLLNIKNNLNKLITLSLNNQSKVLLLGIQLPSNYGRKYTSEFKLLYSELQAQHAISFVSFIQEHIFLNTKLIMPDGVHPTIEAQPLLLESVLSSIEELISQP